MYEFKKPLIDIDGAFIVESVEDVQAEGVFITKKFVDNGRARTSKVYISKEMLHAELCKALGLTFGGEELKTGQEWCDILGARIVDHDGWRGDPSRSWHDRITRAEFDRRLARCTVDSTGYPSFYKIPSPVQPAAGAPME